MNNLSFGIGANKYIFTNITGSDVDFVSNNPSSSQSFSGYKITDTLGQSASRIKHKKLSVQWVTTHNAVSDFEEASKTINKLTSIGQSILLWDDGENRKFVRARCLSTSRERSSRANSPFLVQNKAEFELFDPAWQSRDSLWFVGEEDVILGGGDLIVGTRYNFKVDTSGEIFTVTNDSNSPILPKISLTTIPNSVIGAGPFSGGSNIVLKVEDSFGQFTQYELSSVITPNERYIIDYNKGSFTKKIGGLDEVSNYSDWSITKGIPFPVIKPGNFKIQIFGSGLDLFLEVDFNDNWR